jgi:hypothetical protein
VTSAGLLWVNLDRSTILRDVRFHPIATKSLHDGE